MIENFVFFAISALFLVASGIFLVKSLEKIAKFLHVSEFIAAFLIMAVATSIPELFVGISSAISGNPELSLGNILGANIIDITLLIGIFVVLARGIKISSKKIEPGTYFMFFSVLILIVLYFIGNSLSRIDGIILLSLYLINIYRVIKKSEKYSAKFNGTKHTIKEKISYSLLFIISLIALFLSSKFIVKYSQLIAVDLHIPLVIVGLFLISFATTLPELIFGVSAVLMKHKDMSIGDQVGTVFFNTAGILGIVSIICPISIPLNSFLIPAIFLLVSIGIFIWLAKTKEKLSIIEGISLILIYLLFVIIQFFVK